MATIIWHPLSSAHIGMPYLLFFGFWWELDSHLDICCIVLSTHLTNHMCPVQLVLIFGEHLWVWIYRWVTSGWKQAKSTRTTSSALSLADWFRGTSGFNLHPADILIPSFFLQTYEPETESAVTCRLKTDELGWPIKDARKQKHLRDTDFQNINIDTYASTAPK